MPSAAAAAALMDQNAEGEENAGRDRRGRLEPKRQESIWERRNVDLEGLLLP